ncbi:MAG: PadR family transcriptional regulator, regulatory protein PadR [Sphingomonadales bacterium]|jgi:DNA-binding PadR family transcriptional regulator|nr:PadR family transcriptional regulator, regulatory protein PadR [Sphingomonadales bacterium]
MTRSRALSGQAVSLLAALAASGRDWRHGYDLARATGLRSGTLYPLLIRLEAQGQLEAQWQAPAAPGRPPRHAYRLTAAGLALARGHRAAARSDEESPRPAGGEAYS